MADGKNKVIVYTDWIHAFELLNDEEAGRLIKHFFRYINDKNPETNDRIIQIAFEPIKQTLKRDLKAYEETLSKRSGAGKKGMENRWKDNTVIKPITQITDKDKVSVTDKVSDIKIKGDFFYIGREVYKIAVSHFMKDHMQQFLESWQMKNPTINAELVFQKMDKERVGEIYSNESHIQNAFKTTAKSLLKEEQKKTNTTTQLSYKISEIGKTLKE